MSDASTDIVVREPEVIDISDRRLAVADIPPDGIHRGVPASTYHGWPLPSSTLLNEMWRRSPAHAQRRMSEPLDSASLRIGTALHLLVLEGEDAFREGFAWGGPINPKTGKPFGSDTDKFRDWAEAIRAEGKECITTAEADAVRAMAASLIDHPGAYAHLMATKDEREVSGVFTPFDDIGLRAKFRADGIATSFGAMVDLKTTQSANYWDWRTSVVNYGYHRQAALYLKGANRLGLDVQDFVWVCVEKEPPYAVGLYRLDMDDLGIADTQVEELLRLWHQCVESGEWPAYDDECITVSLPHWARKQTLAQRRGTLELEGGGW
jgi:hypothetical protein